MDDSFSVRQIGIYLVGLKSPEQSIMTLQQTPHLKA